MPHAFGIINDLESDKSKYGLDQLKVIRLFETHEYKNKNEAYSYDCVLHDKMGSMIHATTGKNLIPKFKPILSEGKVYAFMNFVVAENAARYKTSEHNYKVLIFNQTHIREVTNESFPTHIFNFKSFDEIKELKKTQEGLMFDVIGAIGSCYKPELREINESTTKLVDFILEDEQRNTISCTFWEEYVNQLIEILKSEPKEPVAVIMQFCRPTQYKGELKVTNAFCATKLICDKNVSEIQEFNEKYAKNAKVISTLAPKVAHTSLKFLDKKSEYEIPLKAISELQGDKKRPDNIGCMLQYLNLKRLVHGHIWLATNAIPRYRQVMTNSIAQSMTHLKLEESIGNEYSIFWSGDLIGFLQMYKSFNVLEIGWILIMF